jgi:hypothetical protein
MAGRNARRPRRQEFRTDVALAAHVPGGGKSSFISVGKLATYFIDLAGRNGIANGLADRQQRCARSLRTQAERAGELIPDRRRGHRPIRPVEALIELRLKLRGKLRNQMLSLLWDQTPAEHANPEQQCPLGTVALQRGGARYRHDQTIVGRLGACLRPH